MRLQLQHIEIHHNELQVPHPPALPLFYAFTECDIVSSFYGKGRSVQHMMFRLKLKGKMISLMF